MRLQVLASGSGGNAAVLRAGGLTVLLDAGLGLVDMRSRIGAAGVGLFGLDHVFVSHAHLDHARSSGKIAQSHRATLHAPEAVLQQRSCRAAKSMATLPVGKPCELRLAAEPPLVVQTLALPHDCDPTLGFRFEHDGRVLVHMTDLGEARADAVVFAQHAHVLVLEFNYDSEMLAAGPYSAELQRRVRGPRGHLSNEQGAELLAKAAGPELHTVVLAHLSEKNNRPDLAEAAARAALVRAGRAEVTILVARQDDPLAELAV